MLDGEIAPCLSFAHFIYWRVHILIPKYPPTNVHPPGVGSVAILRILKAYPAIQSASPACAIAWTN
jgi:hypothetical protein